MCKTDATSWKANFTITKNDWKDGKKIDLQEILDIQEEICEIFEKRNIQTGGGFCPLPEEGGKVSTSLTKFQVLENGKPAIIEGNEEWQVYEYPTFAAALNYAQAWLGHWSSYLPEDWDGSPIDFTGRNTIEIREEGERDVK